MPTKKTLKSQIAAAADANPTFDPLQISEVLKAGGVNATPAYCEQIMAEYKEKKAKAGIDNKNAGELVFTKVNDKPAKAADVETAKKKAETEKKENEKPKKVETGVREPNPEEIKRLEEAAKKTPPDLMQSIMSGKAKPLVEAIFSVENWVLAKVLDDKDPALSPEAVQMLVNTWTPLVDGWLVKLSEKYPELYMALITTAVMHIPLLLKIADKYLTASAKKKEEAKKAKTP